MRITSLAKRIALVLCIFLVAIGQELRAQNESSLVVGARVGFASNHLAVSGQARTLPTISPVVGGFAQYQLSQWLSVSADLLYTQYGGNSVNPSWVYSSSSPLIVSGAVNHLTIKSHTLEVPIAAKLGLPGMNGAVRPFLAVGCAMAYNIQTNAVIESYKIIGVTPMLNTYTDDVSSAFNQFTAAFTPGAGIDFSAAGYAISMEVYYRMGLINANKNHRSSTPNFTTNAFGFKVGIGLGL